MKYLNKIFKRNKIYSSFRDNIWGVDLAEIQLISKYNKNIKYLLHVIDLFSKYAWVIPLKSKKEVTITSAFQKTLHSLKRKPNKIWVDQGSGFYNNSCKKWLRDNDIRMYSTHNEGKSVVAEIFIKTLKDKINNDMRAISKNICFNVLEDIVINTAIHTIEPIK